jgi:precorrin-2 methylase
MQALATNFAGDVGNEMMGLCPICKVNFVTEDETVCSTCMSESDLTEDELDTLYGGVVVPDAGEEKEETTEANENDEEEELEIISLADIGEDDEEEDETDEEASSDPLDDFDDSYVDGEEEEEDEDDTEYEEDENYDKKYE